jgi:hypothetical protein
MTQCEIRIWAPREAGPNAGSGIGPYRPAALKGSARGAPIRRAHTRQKKEPDQADLIEQKKIPAPGMNPARVWRVYQSHYSTQ